MFQYGDITRDMDYELYIPQTKRRLGLSVQKWPQELEFSQSNSSFRDLPEECINSPVTKHFFYILILIIYIIFYDFIQYTLYFLEFWDIFLFESTYGICSQLLIRI